MKDKNLAKLFLLNILMIVVLLYSNELVNNSVTLNVLGYGIFASVLVFPFLFLISNFITKLFGSKESIKAIIITIGIQLFLFWINPNGMNYSLAIASLISFAVAMGINVLVYTELLSKKINSYTYWLLLYIIVLLIDNFCFLLFLNDFPKTDDLLMIFFISTFVKIAMGAILAAIELFTFKNAKKIKTITN
ncbi:MAG: hypothetical protein RR847_00340 [Bacilli bacterium]